MFEVLKPNSVTFQSNRQKERKKRKTIWFTSVGRWNTLDKVHCLLLIQTLAKWGTERYFLCLCFVIFYFLLCVWMQTWCLWMKEVIGSPGTEATAGNGLPCGNKEWTWIFWKGSQWSELLSHCSSSLNEIFFTWYISPHKIPTVRKGNCLQAWWLEFESWISCCKRQKQTPTTYSFTFSTALEYMWVPRDDWLTDLMNECNKKNL